MDEAERCHRLAYIAYGKLLAQGTADEVVRQSGLHTWQVADEDLATLADELRLQPGVEMVAAFGTTLHVSGTDPEALRAAIAPFRDRPGATWREVPAGLEDAFIKFMRDAQDNIQ
jgi:ABC-2 type transport system ATP-binding protein